MDRYLSRICFSVHRLVIVPPYVIKNILFVENPIPNVTKIPGGRRGMAGGYGSLNI